MEQIRYATYTLERAVTLGGDARATLAEARLYLLLTGSQCVAAMDWTIAEAAAGGAQVIQLREKELSDRESDPAGPRRSSVDAESRRALHRE